MQGRSVGGESRQIVMFRFLHVVFVIIKTLSFLTFIAFSCVECPRKSSGDVSGVEVAALVTCRRGCFSFGSNNGTVCDITCVVLYRAQQFITYEMKNGNFCFKGIV